MNIGIKQGDYIGKTIIFAKNKKHANLLENLFNEMYKFKGKLATVIYSEITEKSELIRKFKEEDFPRIAISVDLMDTGIDVPEIVNLVFAKPIYSKVKFWQMIGRGTRRCDNLFGDGVDKKEFVIFDCYKNFEFFELKPDGYEPKPQKTSIQVRFEIMCKLLEKYREKTDNQKCEDFIKKIKADIEALPKESIEIKKNRKKIEQVKKQEYWNHINADFIKKLRVEIAKLMQWIDVVDNGDAISFDNSIYRIMHTVITEDNNMTISEINSTIEKLSKLKLNLNQFEGKREFVKSLLNPTGWEDLSYSRLEHIRVELRELMKYKGSIPGPFIVLDVKDTGGIAKEISAGSVLYSGNMEPYEKRVKNAIEEKLNDQIVIHKIKKGQQLTEKELESIYKIFGEDFVYSINELSSKTDIDKEDIVGIIRRFIGVDEEELNKIFENFIQSYHSKMNSTQIKTLEIIKNDIAKNKGISFASLFTVPYTQFNPNGVDGIFGKLADEVFHLIAPFKVSVVS
ncbi:MAG: type I restriction enzyme R subunit [Clostridium sp.]|jgi:type I restriction enzyme R subunit